MGDFSFAGLLAGALLMLLLPALVIALLGAVVLGVGLGLLRICMSKPAYDTMVGTLAADAVRAGARKLFGARQPR